MLFDKERNKKYFMETFPVFEKIEKVFPGKWGELVFFEDLRWLKYGAKRVLYLADGTEVQIEVLSRWEAIEYELNFKRPPSHKGSFPDFSLSRMFFDEKIRKSFAIRNDETKANWIQRCFGQALELYNVELSQRLELVENLANNLSDLKEVFELLKKRFPGIWKSRVVCMDEFSLYATIVESVCLKSGRVLSFFVSKSNNSKHSLMITTFVKFGVKEDKESFMVEDYFRLYPNPDITAQFSQKTQEDDQTYLLRQINLISQITNNDLKHIVFDGQWESIPSLYDEYRR